MSRTTGQETSVPASAFPVVWFAPDRPVEGNTIYIRPAEEHCASETDSSTDGSAR